MRKVQLLNVQRDTRVLRPDGVPVCPTDGMAYLGTVLTDSGRIDGVEQTHWTGQIRNSSIEQDMSPLKLDSETKTRDFFAAW